MKKRPRSGLMFITALIFLMFMTSERATAVSLTPIVDGTIRDGLHSPKDGVPDSVSENTVIQVLDVDRDRLPFEDRGIIEFTVSRLSQPIANAELVLIVRGTTGPFPFTIDLFTYTGDGSLSLDDFNAGSLFTSFDYSGESTITLDVTPFIEDLVASEDDFAGFNFQFAVPTNISMNGPFVAFNSLEYPPAANLFVTVGPVPVPDIIVTDSVLPDDDLQVPFGVVTEGATSDHTITVFNDGTADLAIGDIAKADILAPPFNILNDTCSGQTLIPGESRTITVRFSPTTTGTFDDTFDIPSNDPDEDPVTMSVSGTSLAACKGDFDSDGDVDGSDLAELAADVDQLDLSVFAANFARTDCLD